jgi:DnaJ-class molecular chaperone
LVVKEPFGNCNQTLKFHLSNHIPHNIRKFGVPSNYNGSIGEHHLKVKVKIPSRLTQKRPSVLAQQANLRDMNILQ